MAKYRDMAVIKDNSCSVTELINSENKSTAHNDLQAC